jgi:hypothetical protein
VPKVNFGASKLLSPSAASLKWMPVRVVRGEYLGPGEICPPLKIAVRCAIENLGTPAPSTPPPR